jgi:chemotaxis protein MotB
MALVQRFKSQSNNTPDNPFWISFSDLMAGLLFVFILIFAVMALALQEERESRQEITETIVGMLLEQFEAEYNYPVEISKETGTITVSEGVLFEFNETDLTPAGRAFLNDFIPQYCAALFRVPEIRDEIAAVIVEGHTDEVGSYQFNMALSLRRALSVIEYIFDASELPDFVHKTTLQQKLSANGRSKVELKETPESSRRVEFKFRLRDLSTFEAEFGNLKTGR